MTDRIRLLDLAETIELEALRVGVAPERAREAGERAAERLAPILERLAERTPPEEPEEPQS